MLEKYTIVNDLRSGAQYMILEFSDLQNAYWCADVTFDDNGNVVTECEHWISKYDIDRCIKEGDLL